MDDEGSIQVGASHVTEKFPCLVCKELPKTAVYQCINGHLLCCECYPRLRTCPGCRCQLATLSNAIRNLQVQSFLDEIVILECPFKENGCGKKMPRNMVKGHSSGCSYNFQKFGRFANLCKKLGFPTCNFLLNNGNTAVAIKHFISEHGFNLTQLETFQMDLQHFKEAMMPQTSSHFWIPIIAKLPQTQGHVLLVPMLNQTQDFAYLSIWLPDSSDYSSSRPQCPVRVEYAVPLEECSDRCRLVFLQTPMTITEAVNVSLKNLVHPIRDLILKEYKQEEPRMRIICKIKEICSSSNGVNEACLETFLCKINPPLQADPLAGATRNARKWVKKEGLGSKADADNLWEFLCTLFNPTSKPDGYSINEIAYLQGNALRLVLSHGTSAQLNFLKKKGFDLTDCLLANGKKRLSLRCVLFDEADKRRGLEKIKFLVNYGVDYHYLYQRSFIHDVALHSSEEIVKYVLEELKFDVNAIDVFDWTPLHYATRNEDAIKVMKLLLDHGADPKMLLERKRIPFRSHLMIYLRSYLEERKPITCSIFSERF